MGTWTSGADTKIDINAFSNHTFDIGVVSIGGTDLAGVLNRKCGKRGIWILRIPLHGQSRITAARFGLQAKNGAFALVVCGDQVSRARKGSGRPGATG